MTNFMAKFLFLFILLAFTAPAAFSQDDYNKYDIYAGYSHNRVDLGGRTAGAGDSEGFNGFEVAVKGNISRYIGIKGDYSYHRKSFTENTPIGTFDIDATLHTVLGGVELKDNSTEKRAKPFAHFLAGVANARLDANFLGVSESENRTGFAGVIGGGVDVRLSRRVDVRVIQLDYNPTHLDGETQHNFRVGIGLVFR